MGDIMNIFKKISLFRPRKKNPSSWKTPNVLQINQQVIEADPKLKMLLLAGPTPKL